MRFVKVYIPFTKENKETDSISEKCSRPATPATVTITKIRSVQKNRGTRAKGRPRACMLSAHEYMFGMLIALFGTVDKESIESGKEGLTLQIEREASG